MCRLCCCWWCCCCRCTDLQDLDDTALKVCLKAASYKLLYPGTAADSSQETGSDTAQQLKDGQQADGSSGSSSHANDLASLHSRFQGNRGKVENMLSRTVVSEGSWDFAEQAVVVLAVVGLGAFVYSRVKRHRLKGKDHRSE